MAAPSPPTRDPVVDEKGMMTWPWLRWFLPRGSSSSGATAQNDSGTPPAATFTATFPGNGLVELGSIAFSATGNVSSIDTGRFVFCYVDDIAPVSTTLAAGITATNATMTVASSVGYAVGDLVLIGSEVIRINSIVGTTWTVTRGWLSSTAAVHAIAAPVYQCEPLRIGTFTFPAGFFEAPITAATWRGTVPLPDARVAAIYAAFYNSFGKGVTETFNHYPGTKTGSLTPLAKGDLLGHDGTTALILPKSTDGKVLTLDSTKATGLDWTVVASDIDVQKAGALIGTRRKVNFTEDGNVTLTIADNPGQGRVDIGVQALPGGAIPPYNPLWLWNMADLSQFSLGYTGGGGPWTVPDVTVFDNADNSAGAALYDHYTNVKFYNPGGTAANVFYLYSTLSVVAAGGNLLYVVIDQAYQAGGAPVGIIICKPGSETTDYYRLWAQYANFQLYKAVAGVEHLQADNVAVNTGTGHQWTRVRLFINTSGAAVGGIPAGGMNCYQGSVPVFKKTMACGSATVLSGAVKIGFRIPGSAGAGNSYLYSSRMGAYSVGADCEQIF